MSLVRDLASKLHAPTAWSTRPLEDDVLAALLGAARIAPSADNAQTWRFVTVRDPQRHAALTRAVSDNERAILTEAPVLIAALAEPWIIRSARAEQPFFMVDVPIAIVHMCLQAAEVGLAVRVAFDLDEAGVRAAVRAPTSFRVVAVVALGYPTTDY
jgi:nitroreductase